jgi:hypothetical protein
MTMTLFGPEVKIISSTEFIRTYSSSMFKLKKLIADGEIKATKRNNRYLINVESAERWYNSLFNTQAA